MTKASLQEAGDFQRPTSISLVTVMYVFSLTVTLTVEPTSANSVNMGVESLVISSYLMPASLFSSSPTVGGSAEVSIRTYLEELG